MDTLKIGILGAGRIGKVHAASITQHIDNAEVIAVADPNIGEAIHLTQKLKIPCTICRASMSAAGRLSYKEHSCSIAMISFSLNTSR